VLAARRRPMAHRLDSSHGLVDVIVFPAALGSFAALCNRAHDVELGELVVPVAARTDLIAMKQASSHAY
jgi:hypothetical protein